MSLNQTSRIWKKRTLFGYSRDYVKAQLDELHTQHQQQKEIIESEIENARIRNQELRNILKELELTDSAKQPIEADMSMVLLQKHIDTTQKVLDTNYYLKSAMLQKEEELQAKKVERDKIVAQLKEGLQQLHSTFSNMGGV